MQPGAVVGCIAVFVERSTIPAGASRGSETHTCLPSLEGSAGKIANRSDMQQAIVVRGARTHNLRRVSLSLPHGRLIVFTGVSGSGKSSLAFDTLYAEGQRRYIASLSNYARQFLDQLPRPDVDSVTGIPPALSIDQKSVGRNPRSTVGTLTEIYDFLRVIWARVGQMHC